MEDAAGPRRSWTDEETIVALYLYFQLPFGRLHSGNPEIRHLASSIHRSSSSVAMKLCNFASLDPKITETGRKGLAGASKRDRALYAAFSQDWTGLVGRAESLWQSWVDPSEQRQTQPAVRDKRDDFRFQPWQGASTTQALIEQRVGQGFFRRAVLANYEERCAITGIADPRLLVASHIRPWGIDTENRHNPANGLLLSATFDRAFDRGLITVDIERRIHVSRELRESPSRETRDYFARYERTTLRSAVRFDPDAALMNWHRNEWFIDAKSISATQY